MKSTAVKFNGTDLSLETFELPPIKSNEILAKVVCDTMCLSTYKAYKQGKSHVRIPENVEEKPVIIGHEFCGDIISVGEKWKDKYQVGDKFIIQPAINYKGSPFAPGYSYEYIGGSATYVIIPNEVMEQKCLLKVDNNSSYFSGSLAEPLSCIVGGAKKMIHTKNGEYTYYNGIKENGNLIILGGAGPMGIATVSYFINAQPKPKRIVVLDNVETNLQLAEKIVSQDTAQKHGVELHYVLANDNIKDLLMDITDHKGYDDVFVYAAVKYLVELGDSILAEDGCINLFAGPYDKEFKAEVNFYNIHYKSTHAVGLSGGTTEDMIEYISLLKEEKIDPSLLITHIGGLGSVVDAIPNLNKIPGGKKLIYTHYDFPLTKITELESLSELHPVFHKLSETVKANNNMWTKEAEDILLALPE